MNTRLSKTISVLAVASLLTAGSVVAQNHKDDNDWQKRPPSTEEKLARISTALGLSDEQSVQMLVVLQQQTENRAALHEQKMELLGPEICAQRAETEDAILAILTAEQTELFLQIKEDRQSNPDRKGHAGKRPGELDCPD
jgi:Spy/CpxP family protein refolding chaperone